MLFLYSQSFSMGQKKANYEYYEPKTLHESSLSPAIHSILACELGKMDEALKFFANATRLDLDNYNRNANEGLHISSIAIAWVNIVYGFGGLRTDGDNLSFAPVSPPGWNGYSFSLIYKGSKISVRVNRDEINFTLTGGMPLEIFVYGKEYLLGSDLKVAKGKG
jgi:maltose phosphorylase